jgi:heat shock protein HslJ
MTKLMLIPLAFAASLGGCLTPVQPPSPGAYLATGHTPDWNLVIDERNITFVLRGADPIMQPAPPPIIGIAGEIYQTPRINVNVVHAACTDVVTGRAYHDRVQIDVNGRHYEGCGGDPGPMAMPAALAGTEWRVSAVNGTPTPPGDGYYMRFEAHDIAARFGCNSMGGNYVQHGNELDVRQLISTQMACGGPSMAFERQGSAILSHPMTIGWNGNVASLSNATGRIDLSRTAG